jgi:hypothetical protein
MWPELDGYLRKAERLTAIAEDFYKDRIVIHRDTFEFARAVYELKKKYTKASDYEAAIEYLKKAEPKIEKLGKYRAYDGYWPQAVYPAYKNKMRQEVMKLKLRAGER